VGFRLDCDEYCTGHTKDTDNQMDYGPREHEPPPQVPHWMHNLNALPLTPFALCYFTDRRFSPITEIQHSFYSFYSLMKKLLKYSPKQGHKGSIFCTTWPKTAPKTVLKNSPLPKILPNARTQGGHLLYHLAENRPKKLPSSPTFFRPGQTGFTESTDSIHGGKANRFLCLHRWIF